MNMSKLSRVIGHGITLFFVALGVGFLVLGLNDGLNAWLDSNSTCTGGSCPDGGVRATFMILGISFIAAGLIGSVAVELVVRKTSGFLSQVSATPVSASSVTDAPVSVTPAMETIGDLLESRGIHLTGKLGAIANIHPQVIDLRGQRPGNAPTDPAAIGDYLKSFGISIDQDRLQNARVIQTSNVLQPEAVTVATSEPAVTETASLRESATIVRKRDRGETVGDQRLLELELEVTPVGRVPYRVTIASLVRESLAGLLIEGATLNVRVEEHNPNAVTIDWSEN